jgi:hypothetical protein
MLTASVAASLAAGGLILAGAGLVERLVHDRSSPACCAGWPRRLWRPVLTAATQGQYAIPAARHALDLQPRRRPASAVLLVGPELDRLLGSVRALPLLVAIGVVVYAPPIALLKPGFVGEIRRRMAGRLRRS